MYIPKPNGSDNFSKLTTDWKKYNYRETAFDMYPAIKGLFNQIPTQYGVGESLIENTGISWENDEWNIMDAMKIVANFYKNRYASNYGPVMWNVGDLELVYDKPFEYYSDKTLQQLMDDDINVLENYPRESNMLVQEYILKKLNWNSL